MRKFKMILSVVMLTILPFIQGCIPLVVGAAAGAGGYAYLQGALVKNLDASVKEVDKAATKALRDLDYSVISDELNAHDATIKARDVDNKEMLIKIDALTEKAAKIDIRVGLFGDKEKSIDILNAIEKRL